MAINLLPSEHKTKHKKQKSDAGQQKIEMTGAEKFDKKESGIKKAGVLSFFKQSVAKPKEDKKEEVAEHRAKKMPEKKVNLKQKISYKNVIDNKKPKFEYQVPDRKPAQQKTRKGFFTFGKGSKGPELKDANGAQKPKVGTETKIKYDPDKESFPKYDPISAEKVASPVHKKAKHTMVVEVTTRENHETQKKSAWQKFTEWLSAFFGNKQDHKEFKDPDKISNLDGFPKPKDGEINAKEEKIIIDEKPDIEYENKQKEISKKIGQPKELKEKGKLFSYATPIEVEEEITVEKPEEKEIKTPQYKPDSLSYDKTPAKQEKIVASNFLDKSTNINMDQVIKEAGNKKKEDDDAKKKGIWQRFKEWLSNLFKKRDKEKIEMPTPPPMPINKNKQEKKITEPDMVKSEKSEQPQKKESKEAIPESESIKPSFIADVPRPPAPEIKKEFIPEGLQKKEEPAQISKQDIDVLSPPVPAPPPPDIKESKEGESIEIKKSQEDNNLVKPTGLNGEQVNWEVNLIPEEDQEKEIPISKIFILVASVIVSIGIVFGGWVWANYYYNTITVTISKVDAEIADLQTQIAQYSDVQEEAESLQQQIENVELLLEKHVYWSEFFKQLELYTTAKVYYKNMTADINGNITLSAVTDSYENVIKQLYVFREAKDFVTDVTISNITREEPEANQDTENTEQNGPLVNNAEVVNFTVSLVINPSLFYFVN